MEQRSGPTAVERCKRGCNLQKGTSHSVATVVECVLWPQLTKFMQRSAQTRHPASGKPRPPRIPVGFQKGEKHRGHDLCGMQLQEKCRKQFQELHVAFIDLTKAKFLWVGGLGSMGNVHLMRIIRVLRCLKAKVNTFFKSFRSFSFSVISLAVFAWPLTPRVDWVLSLTFAFSNSCCFDQRNKFSRNLVKRVTATISFCFFKIWLDQKNKVKTFLLI